MKDLYNENFISQMKEIEEDTNKWKDIPIYGLGKPIVKMPIQLSVL